MFKIVVFIVALVCPFALVVGRADYGGNFGDEEDDIFRESANQNDRPVTLTKKLDIGDSNTAWVFDNVIPYSQRKEAIDYVRSGDGMIFTLTNYSWTEDTKSNIGYCPWYGHIYMKDFESTATWRNLQQLIEDSLKSKVKVEHVQSEVSHSLDPRPPVIPPHCAKNRYIVTWFLNGNWHNNDYGQLSFYTKFANQNVSKTTRLENTETVHPKGGRAVLYPSCHVIVQHPPTPSYFFHMITLNIWVSTNDATIENEKIESLTHKIHDSSRQDFGNFKFETERKVDYEKHLTNTFYDSTGEKGLFVFDGIFTVQELRAWRKHLLDMNQAGYNEFDTETLEDNDNVAFLAQFSIDSFMKTDMWKKVWEIASYVSGEDGWEPYDVAVNYIRSSDHTRIHPDSEPHQFEYTFLLYLTEGLSSEHMGETVWVEKSETIKDGITAFTGPGGEEYEPFAAVKPKFGRVAIFRNNVEHSARPLSTEYLGDRYTFAVKVCRNKRLRLIKMCYESFEKVETPSKKLQKLNRQLQLGVHDDETKSSVTTEQLEKLLQKLQNYQLRK